MRMKLLTLIAAALLLSPLPALAQLGQTATLTGTVTDATGAILPGATVTVASESLIGGTRSTTTDANGVYRFPALPPGVYTVTSELSNFKKSSQEARLELGQTITLDMKLEVGGLTDVVEVAGSSPTVDVKSSSADKNLPTEFLELIPFSSRFGPGAMLTAPGVNPTQLQRLRQRRVILERAADRRRRRQRSRGGHDLGLRQPQLAAGSSDRRSRRQRGIRRVHGRFVQQPVPVRQQPLPRALRDAVRERLADRQQHQRRDPRTESLAGLREDQLRHRHDLPDRRSVQAGQALVLHELPVLPSQDVAVRLPPDHSGRNPGRERGSDRQTREVAALPLQADHQAWGQRPAHRLLPGGTV